jgi:AhpC/TSA family
MCCRTPCTVLGISGQDAESKVKFSDKLGGVPFPLLVDEGDAVRKAFGVKKDLLGLLDVSAELSFDPRIQLASVPCCSAICHSTTTESELWRHRVYDVCRVGRRTSLGRMAPSSASTTIRCGCDLRGCAPGVC